jgi:hypothetical protein
MSFKRYSMMPPTVHMSGEPEAAAMYAGCGVGKIRDCPSVSEVMCELASLIEH